MSRKHGFIAFDHTATPCNGVFIDKARRSYIKIYQNWVEIGAIGSEKGEETPLGTIDRCDGIIFGISIKAARSQDEDSVFVLVSTEDLNGRFRWMAGFSCLKEEIEPKKKEFFTWLNKITSNWLLATIKQREWSEKCQEMGGVFIDPSEID